MKIGFIGLGLMGRGMAANLQKAGYELVVHDLRRDSAAPHLERGARWADTPRALAAQVDVVFTSLPKPADVEAVAAGETGMTAGFRSGAAWFDFSTNGVAEVRAMYVRLAEQGVAFMDAPVSGGPAGAASGKLAIWVGGDRGVFDKFQPVLSAMADQARYIGQIGAGSIAKLCHNLCSAVMMQAIGEAMTIGIKAGLEPLRLYEAMRAGATGRSRSFDMVHRRWLPDNLDPATFQLQLLHKDIRLAVDLARQIGVPAKLSQIACEELSEALNRGWGERDAQTVLKLQQERAGLSPFGLSMADIEEAMTHS